MEQRLMEARLTALEAEYMKKKTAIDSEVKSNRIKIEREKANHANAMKTYTMAILQLESELQALKTEYVSARADIIKECLE